MLTTAYGGGLRRLIVELKSAMSPCSPPKRFGVDESTQTQKTKNGQESRETEIGKEALNDRNKSLGRSRLARFIENRQNGRNTETTAMS